MLLGTLFAGRLGEVIGLRATFVVGIASTLLAALLLALSPVRRLKAAGAAGAEKPVVPSQSGV
jgi:MFS family permease